MLFALLLGIAFNFLSQEGPCVAGVSFSASHLLRAGVALLGFRISFSALAELGTGTVALVVGAIAATVAAGWALAKLMGLRQGFGVLTGGAVAICGASAALAIAAVLPRHKESERNTLFAVVGVTTLSTLAMIIYPIVVSALGLEDREAGIFLGGTIHDVAQVVGAGYMVSDATGDAATLTKLLRVAMLIPLVLFIAALSQIKGRQTNGAGMPWFLVAFAIFMALNETGYLPGQLTSLLGEASRWLLVTAIAALGMKTQLRELFQVGGRAVTLIVFETIILAGIVLTALLL